MRVGYRLVSWMTRWMRRESRKAFLRQKSTSLVEGEKPLARLNSTLRSRWRITFAESSCATYNTKVARPPHVDPFKPATDLVHRLLHETVCAALVHLSSGSRVAMETMRRRV